MEERKTLTQNDVDFKYEEGSKDYYLDLDFKKHSFVTYITAFIQLYLKNGGNCMVKISYNEEVYDFFIDFYAIEIYLMDKFSRFCKKILPKKEYINLSIPIVQLMNRTIRLRNDIVVKYDSYLTTSDSTDDFSFVDEPTIKLYLDYNPRKGFKNYFDVINNIAKFSNTPIDFSIKYKEEYGFEICNITEKHEEQLKIEFSYIWLENMNIISKRESHIYFPFNTFNRIFEDCSNEFSKMYLMYMGVEFGIDIYMAESAINIDIKKKDLPYGFDILELISTLKYDFACDKVSCMVIDKNNQKFTIA